jgi:hypothetical protein
MELWLWVIGGLGTGAIACALVFWRLSKKAAMSDALLKENEELRKDLHATKETAQQFNKPRRSLSDIADIL